MTGVPRDEPCPDCGRFANRGVSIDAVVFRDREVLLVQRGRAPDKGYWATPGGYVDWDETVEDAVAREMLEETSLKPKHMRLVAVRSEPDRHPKQVINFVYLVDAHEGTVVPGDDAADAAWFRVDDLPDLMALDHRSNIAAAAMIANDGSAT